MLPIGIEISILRVSKIDSARLMFSHFVRFGEAAWRGPTVPVRGNDTA